MLSIRSRILKIPEQELKNIKILVFQIINVNYTIKIEKNKYSKNAENT
jgi:hypothetical protein